MLDTLLPKFIALIFALIPSNLIFIKQISKLLRYNPKLGNTTVILTELPGILTKNSLMVHSFFFDNYKVNTSYAGTLVEIKNLENRERTVLPKNHLSTEQSVKLCAASSALAEYSKLKNIEEIISKFFMECGINKIKVRAEYSEIQKIPSSEKKKISTVVVNNKITGEIFAFSKGNPYKLLEKCDRVLLNGKKIDLDRNMRSRIKEKIKKLNRNGEKVIAFAYRGLPLKKLDFYSAEFTEHDLIFLGAVGIVSPLNNEVKESIEAAKKLNIKTYILTAQQEKQALYAAKELNLINPNYYEIFNGEDIREMQDQKLKKIFINKEKDHIFAKLNRTQKDIIIKSLKDLGERILIVEKKKNTFESAVESIKKARQATQNEPKIIYHALSAKIAQVIVILSSVIFGAPLPLNIFTLIAIDFFINTPLELTLKSDYSSEKNTISGGKIVIHGIGIGTLISLVFFFLLSSHGWNIFDQTLENKLALAKINGVVFALFILYQILNSFLARNPKAKIYNQIFSAKIYLFLIIIITALITYSFFSFDIFKNLLNIEIFESDKWPIMIFSLFIFISIIELIKIWKSIYQKPTISESK